MGLSTRHARQIRKGITTAQQVLRSERMEPRKFQSVLEVNAYTEYRMHHRWDARLQAITRLYR